MTTGFTPAEVIGILSRDGGLCAMSGTHGHDPECTGRADTANHRLNRGAGGSKLRNTLSNGCGISNRCNGRIEDDMEYAELARSLGVKLREGESPDLVPLWSPFFRQWLELVGDVCRLTGLTDPTLRPDLLPIPEGIE